MSGTYDCLKCACVRSREYNYSAHDGVRDYSKYTFANHHYKDRYFCQVFHENFHC